MNARVARGRDKVKQRVNAVVPEARVTLDTALLGQNIVVLALEVAHDLLEAVISQLPSVTR